MTKWAWELDGRSPVLSRAPVEVFDLMVRPCEVTPAEDIGYADYIENTRRNNDRNARERRTFKTGSSGRYK